MTGLPALDDLKMRQVYDQYVSFCSKKSHNNDDVVFLYKAIGLHLEYEKFKELYNDSAGGYSTFARKVLDFLVKNTQFTVTKTSVDALIRVMDGDLRKPGNPFDALVPHKKSHVQQIIENGKKMQKPTIDDLPVKESKVDVDVVDVVAGQILSSGGIVNLPLLIKTKEMLHKMRSEDYTQDKWYLKYMPNESQNNLWHN